MHKESILQPALNWSGALIRKLNADDEFTKWLEKSCNLTVNRSLINQWFKQLQDKHQSIDIVLRLLRQKVFYTLMVRDILGYASLLEVVSAMTILAELTIAQSYQNISQSLAQRYGVPIDSNTGLSQELLIIGMGKLGGKELNVSSDIDLVMLYANDGDTNGENPISNQEFYTKVIRGMNNMISDFTEYGFVFRCDLRLRPYGDSGALAWGFKAFENYLIKQGREWERYAWIKARVIPAKAYENSDTQAHIHMFQSICNPFVYRKYFDFNALASMRDLRERIRQDWESRALKLSNLDKTHNIKLGDGGIREIEFIIQLNQLIRAGQMPSLQQTGLYAALYKQRKSGVIPIETAHGLEQAYLFLRRVEHFLQYRQDEQTHLLPRDDIQLKNLSTAMGYELPEFKNLLFTHRKFVSETFQAAFRIAGVQSNVQSLEEKPLAKNHADYSTIIESFYMRFRIKRLPKSSLNKINTLVNKTLDIVQSIDADDTQEHIQDPNVVLRRMFDLIENISNRSSYLALLTEYPETLYRVFRIVSSSQWAAQYLNQYPLLLDGLIRWQSLMTLPDMQRQANQLRIDLNATVLPDGKPDIEQQMNLMRDLQHRIIFQLLVQDLEGLLTTEQLADHLSELADILLQETINRVWEKNSDPKFAVIAYGKLGGKELGYASDLDLVFLYDDDDEDSVTQYTKLGRKMVSWLTTLTSSGRLYDVDLRLRPDGEAGLLAASFNAFRQYQLNHAWTWEHQALTRARFAAGDGSIGEKFENLRTKILIKPRQAKQLKNDVVQMRQKISAARINRSSNFDIKHDRGGMLDVEFITQYLVLYYSKDYPCLLGNLGNIALLNLAAKNNLLPVELVDDVVAAYRKYRTRQHQLRLNGAHRARVPNTVFQAERASVLKLWSIVLE